MTTPLEPESPTPPGTASAAHPSEPVRGDGISSGLDLPRLDAAARDSLGESLGLAPTWEDASRDEPDPFADAAQPGSGIMAELHAEYLRVMRDPSQLSVHADRQGVQESSGEEALTLEQLQHKAQAYRLLDHMMLPSLSVDALLDTFGSLDSGTVFQPKKHVDVLQLFAPEALRDLPPAIPELTRAEHHVISIDSRIRMGGVQPRPEESS